MTAPKGRIVILESPDPMDLLQGRSESQTLAAACRLIGYETASFPIRSERELRETCEYVSTITQEHDQTETSGIPLVLHISCHGNSEGLSFGPHHLSWDDFVECIIPICNMENYDAGFVLSISACGTENQTITNSLRNAFRKEFAATPPRYLFVAAEDEVSWDDITISWVALYYKLGDVKITQRFAIQGFLPAIQTLTDVKLRYFRWDKDSKMYKRFTANA